jgi:DNA-binding transcriptional MerR regulator
MSDKRRRSAQNVASSDIAHLLVPQIRFLRAAGVTLETITKILRHEFRRPPPKTRAGGLEHVSVELADHCGNVIANWKAQPEFLSRNGRPGDLSRLGSSGFAKLVKLSAPGTPSKRILEVLVRYGAVKRLSNGKLRLMSKLFNCTHPSGHVIAFEPSVAFLADAARVLEDHVDTQESRARRPVRFWREVEDATIPQEFVSEFSAFSRRRVMVLMEEVEDWLDQHRIVDIAHNRKKLVRLGIGIFAVAERSFQDGERPSRRALTGRPRAGGLRS